MEYFNNDDISSYEEQQYFDNDDIDFKNNSLTSAVLNKIDQGGNGNINLNILVNTGLNQIQNKLNKIHNQSAIWCYQACWNEIKTETNNLHRNIFQRLYLFNFGESMKRLPANVQSIEFLKFPTYKSRQSIINTIFNNDNKGKIYVTRELNTKIGKDLDRMRENFDSLTKSIDDKFDDCMMDGTFEGYEKYKEMIDNIFKQKHKNQTNIKNICTTNGINKYVNLQKRGVFISLLRKQGF